MSDFITLTEDQLECLWHKLNCRNNETFNDYVERKQIDISDSYPVWDIIDDILMEIDPTDEKEIIAGFLIKRKVR